MMLRKKILLLDDSTFFLATTSDLLKGLGYDVSTAKNGNAAYQKITATQYDMIITEMHLPGMDGLEFTRKVKALQNYRFVPIVMLASEDDTERKTEAKKMGVATFLSKPLKEAHLRSMLQITLSDREPDSKEKSSNTSEAIDRRRAARVSAKLEVFYGENKMLADYLVGYTADLSVGGLFVETSDPFPLGEMIKLKLALPDHDLPVYCQGRVAWVNIPSAPIKPRHPHGMGIEFLNLQDKRVQEYVRFRETQSRGRAGTLG